MIDNPKYKGAWFAEQMDNPAYKGEWVPKQLENPFDDIGAVGFELWTVNNGTVFDNILLCDSWDHAKSVGEKLKKVFDQEKDAKKAWDKANGKYTADAAPTPDEDEDDDDDGSESPAKEDL